jgi:hypothetical protein
MPMMDRNSDAVAALIQKWLVEHTSQSTNMQDVLSR